MTWKYANKDNMVVHRVLENGMQESCLVEEIADWIAEGNTPEPADSLSIPTYTDLRRAAYPPWQDYNDAKVKQASSDPAIQAEGLAQEQGYLEACLAVKVAIPKV